MKVLVAYATAHGSTKDIAEQIAGRLARDTVAVDCLPVGHVPDVDGYDAIVVGSAIHDQAWLPEATRFMRDNTTVLGTRPVWLFSVGMPGALARPLRKWAMREGPKVVAGFRALHPQGDHLFTGAVRPEHLPAVSRLVLHLMGGRFGDFRDPGEIDAWADSIARELLGPGGGY